MKNQTISRSKIGQEPRLYVRAEYSTEGYHVGDLHNDVQIDREQSEADGEMRSVRDVCLDVTNLVETLASIAEGGHLETVHITGSSRLGVSCDGSDIETADEIASALDARGVPVDEFDVYERFDEQHAAE